MSYIGNNPPIVGGPGANWQPVVTSATLMVSGNGYFVDTTSSAFSMTLPSSASLGDFVRILDVAGTSATNNITVARNGHNIQGSAADLTISTNRAGIGLAYVNSTQGWVLIEN